MRIGMASDHGGFALKEDLRAQLTAAGHTVLDFGSYKLEPGDDFPDFVVPLSQAVASGKVERGIAVCGSGVGAAICANKIPGVRACLINDHYSARQGVEDDHMNVLCLGGRVMGSMLAWDLLETFLAAHYSQAERFLRRLSEIAALEKKPASEVGGQAAIPA
ncbi:MAG: RpiB/LacA/LacB family sugar-phosphate isomerase [Acidobacteriaceae bacterium]|nr:RpiB/LacA/LacB family sugar-phosphate isomerase [Acidobacteriaceae bacterium]